MDKTITIREAYRIEFKKLGKIMVDVYSKLDGFPSKKEQPDYYKKLSNIGVLTNNLSTKLLVAVSSENELLGGVVYFEDMKYYGSGGSAITITNASGIRLLAVHSKARGMGIGRALTQKCIQLAKEKNQTQVILHTTKAMQRAWGLYEKMGFKRSLDLDFEQEGFPVYGFRLNLNEIKGKNSDINFKIVD